MEVWIKDPSGLESGDLEKWKDRMYRASPAPKTGQIVEIESGIYGPKRGYRCILPDGRDTKWERVKLVEPVIDQPKLICLKRNDWSAKNDHNFSGSTEVFSLDIDNWRVEVFRSASNRKGRSTGRSTTYETPESHSITRNTVITRDESFPEHHKGGELRVYYSDLSCHYRVTNPGGYLFDEDLPALPYVDISDYGIWHRTIIDKLKSVCLGVDVSGNNIMAPNKLFDNKIENFDASDELSILFSGGDTEWIINKLINDNAEVLIDKHKLKLTTGYDSVDEFILARDKKRIEDTKLSKVRAEKQKLKQHYEKLDDIRNNNLPNLVYALEDGSLRFFSVCDSNLKEKSRVTKEDLADEYMYYKILRTGEVNGMSYNDVCILSFGKQRLEGFKSYRYNMGFTASVGLCGIYGIDESILGNENNKQNEKAHINM